jgi:alkanesulfonate monooxygenase
MPVEFISATHITPAPSAPEIGCDLPSIRGWDVFEDAQDDARHVLPLVRQEPAHRAATGRAPVLNPDSKPVAVPAVA